MKIDGNWNSKAKYLLEVSYIRGLVIARNKLRYYKNPLNCPELFDMNHKIFSKPFKKKMFILKGWMGHLVNKF